MRPRLGQLMTQAGGMYVVDALKRADAVMETLREPSLLGIDDYIDSLDKLLTSGLDDATVIERLYARASDIVSLSGSERNEAIQIAARSLCDLLDETVGLTPSALAAVKVHISTIKLLHRAPDNPELQTPILEGLASVLEKHRGESASHNAAPKED
ncbi:hypothetical protein [Caulobacter sp.]|uniref:hypothetical protein n=1 Tax=Caulobacter sp. TaxID=78 RepID=UPI003BAE8793